MTSKRYLVIALLLIGGVSLAAGLVFAMDKKDSPYKNYKGYDSLWIKVDTCEAKGLTQDALKLVMNIYQLAKKEHNAPQIVKSVIYRAKYTNEAEEFSAEKNIELLRKESESAEFPANAILQSVLAEQYWNYYEQHRWVLYERSNAVNIKNDDVATYDARTLVSKSIWYYQQSLKHEADLKNIPVKEFDRIINKGNDETRQWRPYLYDLLAHRALEFFKNSEAEVTKAANQFSLNDEAYLKPYPDFLRIIIKAPEDSLELKYYSLKLYQSLLKFHKAEENNEALADLELRRFEFINQYSQHQFKDSLYLQGMNWLAEHFEKSSRAAEFKCNVANWWLAQSDGYKPLESNKHQWDRKKAMDICTGILSKHPNTRGEKMAGNTIINILQKSLAVVTEDVLEPNTANRLLCTYRNVNKVYFKIVRSNYFQFQNRMLNHNEGRSRFIALSKLPTVKSFSVELPDDKDYNEHAVEAAIPALDYGQYVLLCSDKENFLESTILYGSQFFTVSDLAYLYASKQTGASEFTVLHRQSGKPMSGVTAVRWNYNYDYSAQQNVYSKKSSHISDKNGAFSIEKTNIYDRYFVQLIHQKDTLFAEQNIYNYGNSETNETQRKTFIFTDRAIYRPGQSIYYKAIALSGTKNNFKLLAKKELKLVFYDVNNQVIAEQKLVSNEYGTVSGVFVAPQGVLTGDMRIADEYGQVNFSVEEYKRPKFEVTFDTLRGSYQLNDEVTVKGLAKAFAGNNIDGAKVKYRVSRGVNYPQWFYWYKPFYQAGSEAEITNGETMTNSAGEFEIKFKALPDPTVSKNDNADFSYTIYADVTDLNGETRSSSVITRVGYTLLQLNMVCAETINRKEPGKLSIVTTNLNGVEEHSSGELTVYKLNQPLKTFRKRLWHQPDKYLMSRDEYYKLFPHDLYADETNQYKWERSGAVFSRKFDTKTSKNITLEELKKLEPGIYCMESVCKDKNGQEVKSVNYITVYDPASSKLPVNKGLWKLELKGTAEPGEKASFIVASSYKDVHALYDVEWEGGQQNPVFQPSLKPLEIAVEEKHRGGVVANIRFVKFGRYYATTQYISVPFSNKELDIEFSSFRNKLLPGQNEEWKLTLKNKKGDRVAAELLAAMYDASLDAFRPNNWSYYLYNSFNGKNQYQNSIEGLSNSNLQIFESGNYASVDDIRYDALELFNLSAYIGSGWAYRGGRANGAFEMSFSMADSEPRSAPVPGRVKYKGKIDADAKPGNAMKMEEIVKFVPPVVKDDAVEEAPAPEKNENTTGLASVAARKNFNETAFFFPQLSTNEKGEVVIKFTIPETLTRWKLMTLAHTKDLAFGFATKECVTQKELMVVPNAPRFLREGDELIFSGKISNLSDKDLSGPAELRFYDAITEKEISASLFDKEQVTKNFSCKKGTSTLLEWKLKVPMALQAAKYKVVAKAGAFSDGEEMVLPVLSNRLMVTETMPLPIKGNQSKQFTFTKFIERNNHSGTLQDHAFTLEFTSNPAWYAVQSLPYLMEYPYECAEQTFSRYYSNALATHIANSKPKIKQVFEAWKNQSPQAFLSNLEKNQELKALVIQETPWLLEAKNESENKKRMGLLFDLNRMSNELNAALNKLENMQTVNGGWPWFKDCPEDAYISQHIVCGLAHLKKLGVITTDKDTKVDAMLIRALNFCDVRLTASYNELKRLNKNYLSSSTLGSYEIQYLYMRSFFPNVAVPQESKEAFEYYKKQAQSNWLKNSRYLQAMIAISLYRYNDATTAKAILKSLKQNSISSEEMGTYWKENAGYFWHEAPIERQALMVEAFAEINGDTKMVDDLKTWLIKNKQTTNWGTTRATTEAIYALLLNGGDWLSTEPDVEIMLGSLKLDPKNDASLNAEPGTGYFKKRFTGTDIKPDMGTIKVSKKGPGVSWGSAYWQYFEQLDKITPHATPLQLSKKLFLQKNSASGPVITPIGKDSPLQIGDKVIVRIELRSDRDLEYVHLKDMRASGFEPINVLSSYKYGNGLGYYESTGDAASNFFISYLPKGTYVFEYPVYVSHKGNFSNGISSIQCMYAPEFTSHSEGIRVSVGGK